MVAKYIQKKPIAKAVPHLFFFLILLCVLVLTSCDKQSEHTTESEGAESEASSVVFTNVRLIPMTEEKVVQGQTVLVEGGEITNIGPTDEVVIPSNALIINGKGSYLMPGLADMHIHTRDDWISQAWPVSPLNLYLANGVTTIRDCGPGGESLTYALRWRDEISAGTLAGPTIYTSGKLLYASPLKDPQGIVRENYAQGFDFLKLYSYLSEEDYQVAISTAEELGM